MLFSIMYFATLNYETSISQINMMKRVERPEQLILYVFSQYLKILDIKVNLFCHSEFDLLRFDLI